MALIDLKTNLKSLKYGSDRIGGGDSGQPYIQTDINRPGDNLIGNMDDGLVRGGTVGALKLAAVDTIRIGKFFTDFPKGPLFIAKQVGLQLSNPQLESKAIPNVNGTGFLSNLVNSVIGFANNNSIGPTRIYNLGINTLAQVPANVIGLHFDRHGLGPVQDNQSKYLAVAQFNNKNGSNRLVKYAKDLLPSSQPSTVDRILNALKSVLAQIPGASLFVKPTDMKPIAEYVGGPGSVYGVGKTLIRRFDNTANGINKHLPTEKGKINYEGALGVTKDYNTNNPFVLGSLNGLLRNIQNISSFVDTSNGFSQVNQTAVKYTNNVPAGANGTINSPTLRKYSELRNQITKQSSIKQNIANGLKQPSVFKTQNPNVNRGATNYAYLGTGLLGNNHKTTAFNRTDSDILAIVFRAINPFDVDNAKPERWAFSAYMKGFKDTFDGTWNEVNYVGRAESFYIYSKFKRNVSFNLDIPCFNKNELFEKHRALGQLASTTAGSYNSNGLLGGVLLKVNVGNYLAGEYAILNNITYDIPDDSSWDVDEQLAMYIKASFSLTIVHKTLPQYSANNATSGFFGQLPNPVKGGFLIPEKTVNKFIGNT